VTSSSPAIVVRDTGPAGRTCEPGRARFPRGPARAVRLRWEAATASPGRRRRSGGRR
jgi:hypothetical protein